MALADYSLGHLERMAVTAESTYGTPVDPTSTDFIRITQNAPIGHRAAVLDDDAKKFAAAPVDTLMDREFIEWGVPELPVRPSGTRGTQCELGKIFEALLGSRTAPDKSTTINAGATTTGGTLASGTGLAVGDWIRFHTLNESARLTAINIGTGVATWEPALSAAPGTGETVTSGNNYVAVPDYEKVLTVYRDLTHTVEVFPGCFVNQGRFAFQKGGWFTFSASGQGMGKAIRMGKSTVQDNPLSDVATSITVPNGECLLFDPDDGPFYIQIDSEVIRVNSVTRSGNFNTLGVTRAQKSTAAAAHAQGAAINPWMPTPTYAGTAISAIKAFLQVNDLQGVRRAMEVHQADVQITNGFEGRDAAGSPFALHGVRRTTPVRAVQATFVVPYKRLDAVLLRDAAQRRQACSFVMQVGDTEGRVVVLGLPRFRIDPTPPPEAGPGDDTMITFVGRPYSSAPTLDDSIGLATL